MGLRQFCRFGPLLSLKKKKKKLQQLQLFLYKNEFNIYQHVLQSKSLVFLLLNSEEIKTFSWASKSVVGLKHSA